MKKHLTGLIGVFAFLTSFGAFASDLWDAEKFGMFSGFYSKWGERHEGAFLFGYEYVPQELKYGIGFRVGIGDYFADQKTLDKGCGLTVPLSLYLPVHIMESLTVYAGGGLDVHLYSTHKDEDTVGKYDGSGVTENLFAGVRYNFTVSGEQSVYIFGEYCQDFGEISVKNDRNTYTDSAKVDMSGSRFLVGIGILFW